jgi:hypothetical protein
MNAPAIGFEQLAPDYSIAVFHLQCTRWAKTYAEDRRSLHDVVDLLEALAPLDLDVGDAQAMIADAITAALDKIGADDDDYAGLTKSFARLCRAADQANLLHNNKTDIKEVNRSFQVAESTVDAARYLFNDPQHGPQHLEVWLATRCAAQRAEICRRLEGPKPRDEDDEAAA